MRKPRPFWGYVLEQVGKSGMREPRDIGAELLKRR